MTQLPTSLAAGRRTPGCLTPAALNVDTFRAASNARRRAIGRRPPSGTHGRCVATPMGACRGLGPVKTPVRWSYACARGMALPMSRSALRKRKAACGDAACRLVPGAAVVEGVDHRLAPLMPGGPARGGPGRLPPAPTRGTRAGALPVRAEDAAEACSPSRNLSQSGMNRAPRPAARIDAAQLVWGAPAQPMFTMMVFLWVKCSSIASSEASLPRPLLFTPP
jgi:hypothetical protein